MKFIVLYFLRCFDYFHKRKIIKSLKKLQQKESNIIFDVGAHQGESIIFFKNKFKNSKIFSFEPLKKNFIQLLNNTKNFNKDVSYFNFALGEKTGKKKIKEMAETSSSTINEINENSKYYKRKSFLLGINKKKMYQEKNILIEKASNVIKKLKIKKIDILKIDTEGYEFNVIKGFGKDLTMVRIILFEHHYDLMIKKKYKFSNINNYLIKQGFKLKYKFKMPFRKTFEYIYSK